MSDQPIRYGVVGLGRAGWSIHVSQLREREDAVIAAVADPSAERQEEARAEFGCQTFNSIDEMLKDGDVEVVVVATPSFLHGPDTIKAFDAGRHVVVEKPMSMSLEEADAMIAKSEAVGKKLFVHQNYRFFREFTHLMDTVQSGILGKVFHVEMRNLGFRRRNDWQTFAKNGGGVLNNTCPHFIDQILQLVGAPITQVMGDLQQVASPGDVEDHVKMFLRAENGCTADMEISSVVNTSATLPKWIICGSCGTLTSDGKTSTIRWFDPAEAPAIEAVDGMVEGRSYGNADALPWQEKVVDAVGTDVGTFYDNVFAVLRRGEAMRVTPESVREVMRVIGEVRKGTNFPGKTN